MLEAERERAVRHLKEAATLWNVGLETSDRVVETAVCALVAGLETPTLALLAGLTRREANDEAPDLARRVLDELGSPLAAYGSTTAKVAAARALAEIALAGERQLAEVSFALEQLLFPEVPGLALPFLHLNEEYALAADHRETTVAFEAIDTGVLREAQLLLDRRERQS